MRLSWSIFFAVLCNSEQVTDVRPRESVQQSAANTPLNGKHLRLITLSLTGIHDEKRNSTGHVVKIAGPIPLVLEWLSRRYNFTYSYLPIIGPFFVDDLPNQRGGISFLRQGEAELFAAAIIATLSRFKNVDLSSPWMSSPFSILIPIPNSSTHIGALIEPMSTEVWICIALSIPIVIASLFAMSHCIFVLHKENQSNEWKTNYSHGFKIIEYVVSVLLSQGGHFVRKQLAIRLTAAAWCLACFVLVQAYSSTLIAFIMSPNNKPIIDSVYDIPNVPGLKITVKRNEGTDALLQQQQTNFPIFKKLGDSLREDPSLRCNKTETCLDKVRSGNHVYIHGKVILQKIIAMDREETGSCHFTMASKSFLPGHQYFLLAKKSPYTETINLGILRMHETGLLAKWINEFNPVSTECILNKKKKKNGNLQISLKNLASAFILLLFGICVSLFVFVVELIYQLIFRSK